MRATRRRRRTADPLASPAAVRSIIERLRSALPELIPGTETALVRLLRAARHADRYPGAETGRGRPGRWKREELSKVTARLGDILARETSARLSCASFVDHHLRLLDFPADLLEALAAGEINLFEAEQLARVTGRRLGLTARQAERTRAEVLSAHLRTKASGERLRRRVNELLAAAAAEPGGVGPAAAAGPEDLEDFDPYDSTHLFWEQLKQLGFAFREIRRGDVTDGEIEELLRASEPILAILSRIERRKGRAKVIRVEV